MKLGCCLGPDAVLSGEAKKVIDSGCAYIELPLAGIAKLNEDEYLLIKQTVEADGLKVDAFNIFVPAEIRLAGDDADLSALSDFLDIAIKRAAELGAKIIVFGSGRSRSVPDGYPFDKAWAQLADAIRLTSDKASAYPGLVIAIEPLNKNECNIINTVPEGYNMVKEINRDNVKLLADLFHMSVDGEPIEDVVTCGDLLCHAHFADPAGRVFPTTLADDVVKFLEALKKAGYTGRVSFECKTENLTGDAASACKVLKEYFA